MEQLLLIILIIIIALLYVSGGNNIGILGALEYNNLTKYDFSNNDVKCEPHYKIDKDIAVQSYDDYIEKNKILNTNIPHFIQDLNNIRLMTYNVHTGNNHKNISSIDNIVNIVKHVNPTILCVQEITPGRLYDILSNIYAFGVMYPTNEQNLNNAIFSKFPIKHIGRIPLNSIRCCATADIEFGNNIISVYNTHLEVNADEKERINQMNTIINNMDSKTSKSKNKNKNINSIICGDFNSKYCGNSNNENVANYLKNNKYMNMFDNYDNLHTTTLYGNVVDYIFANNNITKKYKGVPYIYYSNASDHLPLIVDFKCE